METLKREKNKELKHYWFMMTPGIAWLVLFQLVPMVGIAMAFQSYSPTFGKSFIYSIMHSEWVGLENFRYMYEVDDVRQVLTNTLIMAFGKIVLNILIPLFFALMLNELRYKKWTKAIQTSVYLPHFLSWVILSTIMLQIFSLTGPINAIISAFGNEKVLFFSDENMFRDFIIWSDVWKNFGFNSIIYLAALTGIDPSLYEAADMDGAGRMKKLWHVTLPGIRTTIVLLAILSLGGILDAGFDQVFNLYNPLVYATGDIIDTYVYRAGLQNLDFSFGTAVGLLKSVVSFILITVGYWVAKKLVGYKIF